MIKVRFTGPSKKVSDFLPEFFAWSPGDNREIDFKGKKFLFLRAVECRGKVDIDFTEVEEVKPKFSIGDHVAKKDGYQFNGVIKASYRNKDGNYRVVVEHKDGWAHIFSEGQLVLIENLRDFGGRVL